MAHTESQSHREELRSKDQFLKSLCLGVSVVKNFDQCNEVLLESLAHATGCDSRFNMLVLKRFACVLSDGRQEI
jgi:hypothetical protein